MSILNDIETQLADYFRWLKDQTALRQATSDWVEVTTPHLDRHNDMLQFYVRRDGDGYAFTDDGYTITDLLNSGCSLDSPKRQALLKTTLAGFGVQLEKNELVMRASAGDFAMRKHNFIQAMLAVDDMFYLTTSTVRSLFFEDVDEWLLGAGIRATPKIKITGKSSFDHMLDFVIPRSRIAPERIIETINRPSKGTTGAALFKWDEIRGLRGEGVQFYVMLNDSDAAVPSTVLTALRTYDARPVLWSERDEVVEELAA